MATGYVMFCRSGLSGTCRGDARLLLECASGRTRRTEPLPLHRVLSESTQNLRFADPAVEYGLSDIQTPFEVFERFVSASGWLVGKSLRGGVGGHRSGPEVHRVQSPQRPAGMRRRGGHLPELAQFELDDLKGKTLISTSIGSERLNSLRERGIDLILDDVPQPFDGWWSTRRRSRR